MSLIFDALRRAEVDRNSLGSSGLTGVTEVLKLAELHAAAELKAATESKLHAPQLQLVGVSGAERETSLPLRVEPLAAVAAEPAGLVESAGAMSKDQAAVFSRFQSLQVVVTPSDSHLVCLEDSQSPAAEQFRFLGVRLQHLRRERPLKKILVTSTIPKEGKSMVSANLACTLAQRTHQKVLLVEGDVRRPSLATMFGIKRIPGLCELLRSEGSLFTNIYHLDRADLWLLPSGSATTNPLALLQSGRLPTLFEELAELFDWIVIDSPPILPVADTSIWMRLTDGILLVARQGTTEKRQLQRGLEAIDQKKVVGALLNSRQRPAQSDYYYEYVRPNGSK